MNGMKLNTTQQAITSSRRQLVARFRLRQMSQRDIVEELAKAGHQNPRTDQPWSLGTVNGDIKALEADWKAQALRDTAILKGLRLAELSEVKRLAWRKEDLATILKAIKQECELLGLDAPIKVDIEADVRAFARARGRDEEEAVRQAMEIVNGRAG